ncbi:A disintegrin and metalloproteinase with thrombospondin motifs 1 [Elysia marginata]|uniref:A disintegrin and metalloproteinase with thrombospondin motifs 1 n=1 Tax=Elysia marginata TaxID=1093978 RepID=A0AAV4H8K9_9GAST|nr:A disintegrin and metalloproteinase with thrombospondin motifs 1 [Elysia marginata]
MRWTSLAIYSLCVVATAAVYSKDQRYVIEGYFVFDHEAFANYEREDSDKALLNALTDMDFFLTTVNERLASLKKDGLDIQLRVLKTDRSSGIYQSNGRTDILKSFNAWLETTQAKQRIGYDVAIYLTGHKLPSSSSGHKAGYICESTRSNPQHPIAVVPFDGSTFMINDLLKNIAFILGSGKDGSGSYNIMRSSSSPVSSEEIYFYSGCTAFDIKEFFAARDVSCLLELSGIKHSAIPNTMPEFYNGRAQDPDVLCSRRVHKDSVACRSPSLYGVEELGGDIVCQQLYCTSKTDYLLCESEWPSEGMWCNPNKICRKGKCVDDMWGRKNDVFQGCAFRDTKSPISTNGHSCASMFRSLGPSMCSTYGDKCCDTCAKYKTSYPGCKWGDKGLLVNGKSSSCSTYLHRSGKRQCYSKTVARICCKSCGDWLSSQRRKRELASDKDGKAESRGVSSATDLYEDQVRDGEPGAIMDPTLTTVDDEGQVLSTQKLFKSREVKRPVKEDVDVEP